MKLILDKPSYLKDSLAILSELVSEVRFTFALDGVIVRAMDLSGIAFIDYKLLKGAFVKYELEKEKDLGLKISDLRDVIKKSKDKDIITISLDNELLVITLTGRTKRTFKLNTIDIPSEKKNAPNLDFDGSITTSTDIFNEALDAVDTFTDKTGSGVNIRLAKEDMVMTHIGPVNSTKAVIKLSKYTKIDCKLPMIKSKLALDYLKRFSAGSKISNKVTIHLKEEYPAKFDYQDPDKIKISFILAPRSSKD